MSNQSRNGNNGGVGCCIMNSLVDVFSNLFSTEPYCGNGNHWGNNDRSDTFNNGFVSGVNAVSAANGLGTTNGGCGCNNNFQGGFSSGVRAANALLNENDHSGGCGCRNGDFDAYYAQQYGLYPFNQNGNGCGCGCHNRF